MPDKTNPRYVVLEFDEPVTRKLIDRIEGIIMVPHDIPELMQVHAGYESLGRIIRTEPKE